MNTLNKGSNLSLSNINSEKLLLQKGYKEVNSIPLIQQIGVYVGNLLNKILPTSQQARESIDKETFELIIQYLRDAHQTERIIHQINKLRREDIKKIGDDYLELPLIIGTCEYGDSGSDLGQSYIYFKKIK